jgi:tricorn protease-like protein
MPDSKRILFLEEAGPARIMQAEIGRPARLLYLASSSLGGGLTLAGREPRLVSSRTSGGGDMGIWTLELRAGVNAVGNPKRILYSTGGDHQARYSPDGHRIAFISERTGGQQVWLADSDGGNPRQLTNLQAHIVAFPRWSPDGKFLSFGARVPDVAQSYVVRVEDGAIRQVTDDRGGGDAPSWSMDGTTLYVNKEIGAVFYVSRVPSAGGTRSRYGPAGSRLRLPAVNYFSMERMSSSACLRGRSLAIRKRVRRCG